MKICPKHGEYEPRVFNLMGRQIETSCPECAREDDEARAKALEEERQEIERIRLKNLGIMPRFACSTFDNYQAVTPAQRAVLQACRVYVQTAAQVYADGRNMVMVGNPGTGKNHLATAILKGFDALRYSTRMLNVSAMVREIRSTYSGNGDETEAFARFGKYDLLILNEVGVQFGTDAEKNLVFEVLDDRYGRLKPTVLISNLGLQGLEQFLGARAMDRILERGVVLEFTWASFRTR